MNAEMMAGTLTIALMYGLLLLMHYQVVNRLPRRKKLATIQPKHSNQYIATRERLRTRLHARIGSKTQ